MFSWLLNHTPERRKGIKPRRCRPWPPSASTFGAVAFRDLSITEILIRKSNKSHSDLQKIRCLIVRIYSLIRGSGHAIFTFKSTFYFPLVGHCPFCFFFRTSLCLAQLALLIRRLLLLLLCHASPFICRTQQFEELAIHPEYWFTRLFDRSPASTNYRSFGWIRWHSSIWPISFCRFPIRFGFRESHSFMRATTCHIHDLSIQASFCTGRPVESSGEGVTWQPPVLETRWPVANLVSCLFKDGEWA